MIIFLLVFAQPHRLISYADIGSFVDSRDEIVDNFHQSSRVLTQIKPLLRLMVDIPIEMNELLVVHVLPDHFKEEVEVELA